MVRSEVIAVSMSTEQAARAAIATVMMTDQPRAHPAARIAAHGLDARHEKRQSHQFLHFTVSFLGVCSLYPQGTFNARGLMRFDAHWRSIGLPLPSFPVTPRCTGAKCILISPLSSFSYFFLNYQVHHEDIFALSSMQNCITARDGDPDGEAPLLE